MRADLLAGMAQVVSTLTQFAVSQELPWSQNALPLFRKNLKKIYVDRPRMEETVMIATLNSGDFYQDDQICSVYLAVDAKNPPSQLDSAIQAILSQKAQISIDNFGVESDYTVDKDEDVLIYTFEFRANTVTT